MPQWEKTAPTGRRQCSHDWTLVFAQAKKDSYNNFKNVWQTTLAKLSCFHCNINISLQWWNSLKSQFFFFKGCFKLSAEQNKVSHNGFNGRICAVGVAFTLWGRRASCREWGQTECRGSVWLSSWRPPSWREHHRQDAPHICLTSGGPWRGLHFPGPQVHLRQKREDSIQHCNKTTTVLPLGLYTPDCRMRCAVWWTRMWDGGTKTRKSTLQKRPKSRFCVPESAMEHTWERRLRATLSWAG